MLFNRERALQKMDQYGLERWSLPRREMSTTRPASGRASRSGASRRIRPRSSCRRSGKPAILVVPEFAISGLLETPTWVPQVRTTEFMNTSHVAHEPEPVRLDPLQGDIEALYAEKIAGDMAPNLVLGTTSALVELGLDNSRVGFDDLRLAQHAKAELSGLQVADAIDAWLDIRKVKTPQEIDFLRHGAAINEAGLRDIMPCIRPGVVWKDVRRNFAISCRLAART